jgi:hypothetical protein
MNMEVPRNNISYIGGAEKRHELLYGVDGKLFMYRL